MQRRTIFLTWSRDDKRAKYTKTSDQMTSSNFLDVPRRVIIHPDRKMD